MGKLGVCVIGLGRAGRAHAEMFKQGISGADLVCVSDQVRSVAREVGEKLKVDWVVGHQKCLARDDVQAAVVAVPTHLHAAIVTEALEMNKHVLVEKPLARSLYEARDIVKRVASSGLVVQVGYMRRFDGAYRSAKKMISEGRLGTPILYRAVAHDPGPPPDWASDPKLSGGIFYDMLSHDFDMARCLMSSEVSTVYALGSNFLYEELRMKGDYDSASVVMTFNSGAHGYVEGVRKCAYGYDLRTEVVGSEGSIIVGNISDDLMTIADSGGIRRAGVQWFMQRFRDAFFEEDRSFVESVLNDHEPEVSALDGLRAIEIAEACRISVAEKRPVSLAALRSS
jgi:predicted dehydrogenase